jgi:plasmid stability protein
MAGARFSLCAGITWKQSEMNTNTDWGSHMSGRLHPDAHDWRNQKTQIRGAAVLAKLGYRLQQGSTTAELLQNRNALRAAINDERRRANEAIAADKTDDADEYLENMGALAELARRTQNLLD